MPSKLALLSLLPLFSLLILGVLARPARAAQIKIIVTSDVHGHIMGDPGSGKIGYALLKSHLDAAAREGWRVFLLDSGDTFSGSAYAQVDRGRSVAEAMGRMGYRVLTPGNHAFDHNEMENDPFYYSRVLLTTLRETARGPVDVVALNLTHEGGPLEGVGRDPIVIYDETDRDPRGLRVIVAGVITPYAARPTLRDSIPGYGFGRLDTAEETKQALLHDLAVSLAPYDRPGDLVVVLSHVGNPGPEGDREGRVTGPDIAGVANVDFVADGHSHGAVPPECIGGAVYANAGRYLENFLEISVDAAGCARMELRSYRDLAHLGPEPEMAAWLADLDRRQALSAVVFEMPAGDRFSDAHLATDSTPLGRLICRAMLDASEADLSLHNLGGIRAGLPSGPVSARALYDVLPFGDDLVVAPMTVDTLAGMFNRGSGHGGRGFPQFYGMTVFAWRLPDGRLETVGFLGHDGAPLVPGVRYRVAMNGIMAKRYGPPTERYGELVEVMRRELSGISDAGLEALADERPLRVFDSREEAEAAWEAAGAAVGAKE